VHALLVGIEDYPGLGPGWHLPGTVEDVDNVAAWLLAQGVPAENITLLASSPPESRSRTSHSIGIREPNRTPIREAFTTDLLKHEGDLLLVYWAGHGFLDDRGDLCLPCQDTSLNDSQGIVFERVLQWLRELPGTEFGRQVLVIDACRLPSADDQLKTLIDPPYVHRDPNRDGDREQFVLYACREGQSAKNLPEQLSGQLSLVLREEMAGNGISALSTDFSAVADAVQHRFDELREQGVAWQTPVRVRIRGADKEESWREKGSRQGPLNSRSWGRLEGCLRGVQPEEWSKRAYRWAFEVAECAPFRVPTGDLNDLAEDLGEFEPRADGIPQVVAFAHALAYGFARSEDIAAQKLSGALATWVQRVVKRYQIPQLPDVPNFGSGEETITVVVDRYAKDERLYYIDFWLRSDGWSPLSSDDDGGTRIPAQLDSARTLLDDQIRHLSTRRIRTPGATNTAGTPHAKLRRIEFAVNSDLLEVAFDQWEMGDGPGETWRLGRRLEVVVRCPEKRRSAYFPHLWWERWQWLIENSATHNATHWLGPEAMADEELEALVDGLMAESFPACIALDMEPVCAGRGGRAVLAAGMPVVVWLRKPSAEDGSQTIVQSLREVLSFADVAELPKKVLTMRRAAAVHPAVRNNIVLLWDDPDHHLDRDLLTDAGLATEADASPSTPGAST
jgi:hypothetical protein